MDHALKKRILDYDAVIFDMDGTLVDSMWMWHQIDVEYLAKFGIEVPDNLQQEIEGKGFSETAVYFKNRFHISDSLEKIKQDWNEMAYDKYCNHVPTKEGAEAFLSFLKKHHKKIGIATSNSRELMNIVFEVLHLHQYIDCIMTSCDVKAGKPAPDVYLAVAEKLKVSPDKCLVFEDILPGIQAGKSAGMTVCAIKDDYSADVKIEKMEASDYFIDNYFELI